MKVYDLEQIIKEEIQKNSDHIIKIDDSLITPMKDHMKELKETINHKEGKAFKNTFDCKRIMATAISILIISFFLSFLLRTEPVKAFKLNAIKTIIEVKDDILSIKISNMFPEKEKNILVEKEHIEEILTFKEAKDKIPTYFIQAKYIPEGYKPKEVQWKKYLGEKHLVVQSFESQKGELIKITHAYNLNPTKNFNRLREEKAAQEIKINQQEIIITPLGENYHRAIWKEELSLYEVEGRISKEEMIKIIRSID